MATGDAGITEYELRRAYRVSGLWRSGWTFRHSVENSSVYIALRATVRASRSEELHRGCNADESVTAAQYGKYAPAQRVLFQEMT